MTYEQSVEGLLKDAQHMAVSNKDALLGYLIGLALEHLRELGSRRKAG